MKAAVEDFLAGIAIAALVVALMLAAAFNSTFIYRGF